MIETEQTVLVDAPINGVWDYVSDMRRWAEMMPGMREYDIVDENDSRWTLKVGVGGLVRTVKVNVHVDQWDGPERVFFSYELVGDPVKGGGSYHAIAKGAGETEITLALRVEGGGPMAPMWEAMGRPLLPQLAKAFAGQLKVEIEKALAEAGPQAAALVAASAPARSGGIFGWLRSLWQALFGGKAQKSSS
jgi:carbon monoxide dehydrogenase subunit G